MGANSSTLLHKAASRGNARECQRLLDLGVKVDFQRIRDGRTALAIAANQGHADVAKILLLRDANVNVKDRDGDTPLILAASKGHVDVIAVLLDHGADLTIQNLDCDISDRHRYALPALHIAVYKGFPEVVNLLIARGADVNSAPPCHPPDQEKDGMGHQNQDTPLMCAASMNNVEIIQLLLRLGALVNFPTYDGCSALHRAAQLGNVDACRLLLAAGADTTKSMVTSGTTRMTPMDMAVRHNHPQVVHLLKTWRTDRFPALNILFAMMTSLTDDEKSKCKECFVSMGLTNETSLAQLDPNMLESIGIKQAQLSTVTEALIEFTASLNGNYSVPVALEVPPSNDVEGGDDDLIVATYSNLMDPA